MIELVTPPTDFWGVVVPAWLGAVGTILASAVAVVALIVGRRASSGVRSIASGLNSDSESGSIELSGTASVTTSARGEASTTQPWEFTSGNPTSNFRNTSGADVTFLGLDTTGGVAVTMRQEPPFLVPAGGSFDVVLHRLLGGGAVRGVKLRWQTPDDIERQRTYYL